MENKIGRPATPEYTKKIFRFSAIEKAQKEIINQIKDENERKIAETVFQELKERII